MKGLSIGGFIAAIAGLVLCWVGGWFSIIALPLSIAGLILSAVAGKKLKAAGEGKGLATAGLIIGIIATVFSAIFFFTCGVCVLCIEDDLKELEGALNDANSWFN